MIYSNPNIESSYKENNLGKVLYDIVLDVKPRTIVEFGALNGYSAVCMAMALHEIGKGHIISYDLWTKYPHRNATMIDAKRNAEKYGVADFITFAEGDFYEWDGEPFDLLHVDISNDGDIIDLLEDKVRKSKGIVIFEGGSAERDKVEWVTKYNKRPIGDSHASYKIISHSFPSLSQLI